MNQTITVNQVKIGRPVREFIIREWAGNNAICMLGGFGIGKTETVYQLADELKQGLVDDSRCDEIKRLYNKDYRVFDIKLAGWLPDEVKGVMYFDRETKTAKVLKPEFIQDRPSILFFDEITNVPERTITAILEGIAQHKIGEYHFHPDTLIAAAGNPPHESTLAHKLVSALKTRFTVIDVSPSVEEFSYHAASNKVLSEIIAFVNNHVDELYQHRPDERNMPCPRNYFKLNSILKVLANDKIDWMEQFINGESLVSNHIVSKIGETATAKFKTFLTVSKLVDIRKILNGSVSEAEKLNKISNRAERLSIENFICYSFISYIEDKYERFKNFMKVAPNFSKNVIAASIILMLDLGILEKLYLVSKIGNHYAIRSKDKTRDEELRKFLEDSGVIQLIMDARGIKI